MLDNDQVRVFDGQAMVLDGNKQVKIKAGHEVSFHDEPLKTQKFDKQAPRVDRALSMDQFESSYLAEANRVDAARTYVVGGPGWVRLWMVLGSVV